MLELRRLLVLLRPHLVSLLLAACLAGVLSVCRGAIVLLVRDVLDALLSQAAVRNVLGLALLLVGLFVVQGGARFGRTWLTRKAALNAEATLRERLFAVLLDRAPADLRQEGLGDALSRLSHDASRVRTAVGAIVTIVQRPLTALAVGASAVVMAPRLALWAALGVPVVALVIGWAGRRTRRAATSHLTTLGALEVVGRDALGGLRTVQAYGAERAARQEYHEANQEQVRAALHTTLFQVSGPPLVELVAALAIGSVVVLGSMEVSSGHMTPSDLVAFLVALALLHEPLKGIAVAHGLWEEARGGLSRVWEALDRPAGVEDSADAKALVGPVTHIQLSGVSVDRGRGLVLRDLDLELRPSEIVVVQGESGAGKSTLLDVLASFVPITHGEVRWNGQPASSWTLASRRAAIALVDQDPWLGRGTLGEAIALGRPGASEAQIAQAAQDAGLPADRGLLLRLPQGLRARVGDGGGGVSSGERQRIALARALLRGADLLLLDEPTANLDAATEARFLSCLRRAAVGCSVVVVTHRAAPLAIADRCFELREGRLHALAPKLRIAGAEA